VSGSLKVRVSCRPTGPLENGDAEKAAEEWATNTTQVLADKGVELLGSFAMDKTGRGRGGFKGALKVTRVSPTEARIPGPQEKGVAWSPWLEGTTKRNDTTHFRGYGLFAKTRLQLQKMAPDIAQEELQKVLPRMGGST
jgi:hypothetical protein